MIKSRVTGSIYNNVVKNLLLSRFREYGLFRRNRSSLSL